jgi:lysine-specific demethylase 3
MLLKLKDWPPETDFKKIMPSRFEDIMKNLPMNPYTNRTGDLNIVKYLPQCFIHPDLGPKGYFAYGSPYYLKEGTTNLHLDISDACNVMCYIGFPRDKNISVDEYVEQGFRAIIEGDCDLANIDRVTKDGEIPGAIWHIYEACDADKIRDFLIKIASEKGFKIAKDHDVIHDQNWYLDGELRNRLHSEYGVKGYAFVQFLGDTVILPAGTPHQVRNIYSCIKVAEDFVSPQQMPHCLHLSEEFRKLTKDHTNNIEKLNIKNIAYHSVKEAIASLLHTMNIIYNTGTKIPSAIREPKIKTENKKDPV